MRGVINDGSLAFPVVGLSVIKGGGEVEPMASHLWSGYMKLSITSEPNIFRVLCILIAGLFK